MALPKQIIIKETVKELRALQKNKPATIIKRLSMLIEIKKAGAQGLSKRDLSKRIGVNHNSVQKWRALYLKGGINSIIIHGRIGFKPTIIKKSEHEKIKNLLNNPNNGLRGYKELMIWFEKEFSKNIKYTTLIEYVKKHFGAKIKVARKSHVLKSKEQVEAFKKTSVSSYKTPYSKAKPNSKA